MTQYLPEKSRLEWLWSYGPLAFWVSVIFFLSSSNGSSAETSRIIGPLIEFLFGTVDESTVQLIHAAIRKAAHVTEYAILASLASRAFLQSSSALLRNYWAFWAVLIVTVVASLDEFNQSLNVLRTASPLDTLLDISGGLLALTLIWIVRKRKRAAS